MSEKEEGHLCRRCSNAVKHWKGWELCDFCGHRHHWESGWHDPIPDPIATGLDGHSPSPAPTPAVLPKSVVPLLNRVQLLHANMQKYGYSSRESQCAAEELISYCYSYPGQPPAEVPDSVLRKALEDIAEGCSFPSNDVERAIRDRARAALSAFPERDK